MRKSFPVVIALVIAPGCASAQNTAESSGTEWSRGNRIVVHSPHFDTPLPHWGGLNCLDGPVHLYGFEGEVEDRDPALRIRTFIFNPTLTRQHVFIEGAPKALEPVRAMVHLNSRIDGGREEELPLEPPWVEMADESGLAVFTVPTGEYRIRFYVSGVGEDQGIIRVRGVEGDSIHAYLIPGAICNQ